MADTTKNDMRLAIAFFGLVLFSLSIFFVSNELETAEPESCLMLDSNLGRLVEVECTTSSHVLQENFTTPSLSVFYFQKVPVNQASSELLQTVPGIGPRLAEDIIEYRTVNGRFTGMESIKTLPGVGDKRAKYLMTQLIIN
ncbi:ComEA family DNA-binding protein [Desulforhopalus sp. 52FAK]